VQGFEADVVIVLFALHRRRLPEFPFFQQFGKLCFVERRKSPRDTSPKLEFVETDIVALVFGKALDEHGPTLQAKRQQRLVAAATSVAVSRDALLDEPAGENGVEHSARRPVRSLAKLDVHNALTPRETREFLGFAKIRESRALTLSHSVGSFAARQPIFVDRSERPPRPQGNRANAGHELLSPFYEGSSSGQRRCRENLTRRPLPPTSS
jgi:hypothetical protein